METGRPERYGAAARRFHWWTVAFVAAQIPLGIAMVVRGSGLGIWDGLTNVLYDSHKLLGAIIFFMVAARLIHRLRAGIPATERTIVPWQRRVGLLTHWAMYGLLLTVPVAGWFGVQFYPALDLFGLVRLPAIVTPDKVAVELMLGAHAAAAFALLAVVALHVGAALFHRFVLRDEVFQRMA